MNDHIVSATSDTNRQIMDATYGTIRELNIENLQDTLLYLIFSFLSDMELCTIVPLVSRRFRKVSNSLFCWYEKLHNKIHLYRDILKVIPTDYGIERFANIHHCQAIGYMNISQIKTVVISYNKCSLCTKYFDDVHELYICKCSMKICQECSDMVFSLYQSKCIRCSNIPYKLCAGCERIITPYNRSLLLTCCGNVCEKCTHGVKQFCTGIGDIGIYCSKHYKTCAECGKFLSAVDQLVAKCCNKTYCASCITICYGCHEYHCDDHCENNKCLLIGCCYTDDPNRMGNIPCAINGNICSKCFENKSYTELRCLPTSKTQKLCMECYRNNYTKCSARNCNDLVLTRTCRLCILCRSVKCKKHLSPTIKNYCLECSEKLLYKCQLCCNFYTTSHFIRNDDTLICCTYCLEQFVKKLL